MDEKASRLCEYVDYRRVESLRLRLPAVALAAAAIGLGQVHPTQPQFEVASVKVVENASPTAQMSGYIDHGKAVLNNARLRQIIGTAYGIQTSRIEGGPGWIDSERYQVVAQAEDTTSSEEQVKVMLQTLLTDRCRLRMHKVARLLPNYTLIVAKNGPRVSISKEAGAGKCDFSIDSAAHPPASHLTCTKTPISGLVNALSNLIRAPVLDQTGLSGAYDFTLGWEGDDSLAAVPEAMANLGLRLEMKKVQTEVLVIDGVERPSAN